MQSVYSGLLDLFEGKRAWRGSKNNQKCQSKKLSFKAVKKEFRKFQEMMTAGPKRKNSYFAIDKEDKGRLLPLQGRRHGSCRWGGEDQLFGRNHKKKSNIQMYIGCG